jgi:hypothetical protein
MLHLSFSLQLECNMFLTEFRLGLCCLTTSHGSIWQIFTSLWIRTMNRCICYLSTRLFHWRTAFWAMLVWLTTWISVQAMPVRPFPPKALLGEMQVIQAPEVLINGKPARLSPGARIRGTNNMLTLSASITGQTHIVKYLHEPHGLIHEVWILNPAEIQASLPKP